ERARNEPPSNFFGAVTGEPYAPPAEAALRSHQSREACRVVTKLLELRVREPGPCPVGAAVPCSRPTARGVGVREDDELRRVRDRGQRGVEDAIPQAEDRSVGADTEREREHGD